MATMQDVPYHTVQMAAMFYLFARLRLRMTDTFFTCTWPTNCSYGVLEAAIVLRVECPWAVDMFLSAELVSGTKCESGIACPPPLLMAAAVADTALVCKLMAAGADPSCIDKATGMTALHGASLIDARECIELLCHDSRVDIGAIDLLGNTAAHYLCSRKATRLLLSELVCRNKLSVLGIRNRAGDTAIISAIRVTKNLAVVYELLALHELLALPFGVTTLDNNNNSILHHLVAYTDGDERAQANAKLLLTRVLATLNPLEIQSMCSTDPAVPTPMGLAILRGRMDLAELFSSRGHVLSAADIDGLRSMAALARGAHTTAAFSDLFQDVEKPGLDAMILAALPRITLTAEQLEQKTCTICYDEFEAGATVILLHCAHTFHESCLTRWLKNKTTCPLCRAKLDAAATKE